MPETTLTYQDYLRYIQQFGGSEGGNGVAPMTELEWNALSPDGRWANVGGRVVITPDDPRYEALARVVRGEPGRNIVLQGKGDDPGQMGLVDPSRAFQGPDFIAYSDDMRSPQSQAADSFSDAERAGALAFPIVAGLGYTAATGGLGSIGAGAGGLEGAGITATGAGGAGGAGGGLAGLGEAVGGAGSAGGGLGGAGITATGTAGVGAAANGASSAAGLVGSGGGLVESLGGWQGIARGVGGLAALGASASGGDGRAGETDPQNIIEQMARANRVDHNTPIGSRRWVQGDDGRWTVNDTMSPVEQANFEQVQGLNSSVTGMTRDRLAALLAQGPRPRYDRPLGT